VPGCGSGPTDTPLKRRSACERSARSNRAPGAAAVRWCTAVAHNDRAPGSSPGAATNYARQADRVIWRGAVDAVSAVRVRGLVDRCNGSIAVSKTARRGSSPCTGAILVLDVITFPDDRASRHGKNDSGLVSILR
jgi:hypothetical protein